MNAQLGAIAFVVWRESVEALLVISILDSWLVAQVADPRRPRGFLWSGVAAGLAVASLLAVALTGLGDVLSDDAQQVYQTVTVLIAAALIIQMLVWMHRHARTMKRNLETALDAAVERRKLWGVFVLALIAVAREGSEMVIFLYGMLSAGAGGSLASGVVAALVGVGMTMLTYGLLRLAGKRMPWRLFFSITEVMLMFLAAALLMTGIDGLIDLGILPKLSRGLWNTSRVIPDGGAGGGFISALTGYRAQPNLMELIAYAAYWAAVLCLLYPRRPSSRTSTA
ncbi:FTR1 family protein [Azospirillum sp. TSO35-2]|uniref:FTR1 family iron permease n=1 Tax=Azospirillum sp. TSO35-2 TaxID=716796 RepID=UPI000D605007|nr:FTR1 family protein [Azospirillum sp. TSO35-2]PWC39567.1 FTR1 family iron permease [Azospirillum sp. TSO35-2]